MSFETTSAAAGFSGLPRLPAQIMQRLPVLEQLGRYAFVSAVALGLDFAVFLILNHSEAVTAAMAGAIGYSMGLLLHYVLSVRLVFDPNSSLKTRRRLFAEFAASGLFGICITWAVIHIATNALAMHSVSAKGLAVAVSFLAVFVIRRSIIFAAR